MKIKICGLKRLDDISYVNEAGVDFAGFIFAEKSKRRIDFLPAKNLKRELKKDIKPVGVFVNQSFDFIKQAVDLGLVEFVQLHGEEDNLFIEKIQKELNISVIKAFRADLNLEYNLKNTKADYVLIDSSDNQNFGGTGKTFDWGLIPETNKKIFLAGGLNSNNILSAMQTVRPFCVDVNSGVELNGIKNKKMIEDIVEKVRKYNE